MVLVMLTIADVFHRVVSVRRILQYDEVRVVLLPRRFRADLALSAFQLVPPVTPCSCSQAKVDYLQTTISTVLLAPRPALSRPRAAAPHANSVVSSDVCLRALASQVFTRSFPSGLHGVEEPAPAPSSTSAGEGEGGEQRENTAPAGHRRGESEDADNVTATFGGGVRVNDGKDEEEEGEGLEEQAKTDSAVAEGGVGQDPAPEVTSSS